MEIKLRKKAIAGIVAGLVFVTAGVSYVGNIFKKGSDAPKVTTQNKKGHKDLNPIWGGDEDDFYVLNVGDHNSKGVDFQDRKIDLCNEKGISVGVIIDSDASNLEGIYHDVEYAKSIIYDRTVDFPVYLNINHIIDNPNLSFEDKIELIATFTKKCTDMGMYVGLYGTDTNLVKVYEGGITAYDVYLVKDNKDIKYPGTCYVIEDQYGNISALTDLANTIEVNGKNKAGNLVKNYNYVYHEGDDLNEIAKKYSNGTLSAADILRFNGKKESDLHDGVSLIIPSKLEKRGFGTLAEPIRGCDMSYAQGEDSNWKTLAENFDFIILKVCEGTVADSCFESNAENCSANNIPIGGYCYNGYTKTNCDNDINLFKERQIEQADYTVTLLKNKKIEYPVYLDIEAPDSLSDKCLGKEYVETMLDIWYQKMTDAGYTPGIYSNQAGIEYLQSKVSYDLSTKFKLWIATATNFDEKGVDLSEIKSPKLLEEYKDKGEGITVQVIDVPINAEDVGAANDAGRLDICFTTEDFRGAGIADPSGDPDIRRYDRTDYGFFAAGGAIATALAGTIIIVRHRIKKDENEDSKGGPRR